MRAYDKRIYRDRQKEPFYDPEWEEAERADEKPQYYRQITKCGIIIRKYKPPVAKLVMQRTGMILTPWKGEDDGRLERCIAYRIKHLCPWVCIGLCVGKGERT